VPEEQNAPRRAGEARAVDDVGLAIEDGLQELRVFRRVVLQIRVLDEDDLARRRLDSVADRGSLAAIGGVHKEAQLVDRPLLPGLCRHSIGPQAELSEHRVRAVDRAVVDDDDLLVDGNLTDAAENLPHRAALVEDGHDDR
jgi:hypothetical protein